MSTKTRPGTITIAAFKCALDKKHSFTESSYTDAKGFECLSRKTKPGTTYCSRELANLYDKPYYERRFDYMMFSDTYENDKQYWADIFCAQHAYRMGMGILIAEVLITPIFNGFEILNEEILTDFNAKAHAALRALIRNVEADQEVVMRDYALTQAYVQLNAMVQVLFAWNLNSALSKSDTVENWNCLDLALSGWEIEASRGHCKEAPPKSPRLILARKVVTVLPAARLYPAERCAQHP